MPELTTLADSACARLREDILGQLRLPGTLLAEAAVARDMQLSRVPVREALFALERDGLVEFSDTGRAYVKTLRPEDFEELFIMRLMLEPLGAKLAAPAIQRDASRFESILAATRKAKSMRDLTCRDLDFHEAVMEASGNSRLARIWKLLRSELELWLTSMQQRHERETRQTREVTIADHQKLLRCFCGDSPAVAEKFMRQHVESWRKCLPSLT